jgi:hypothetical protein
MWRIRSTQMAALQRTVDDQFLHDLAAHLRRSHADAVARRSGEPLEARVRRGLARARSHGIASRRGIATFIATQIETVESFDEHPIARPYFADPSIPPELRMRIALSHITDDDWRTIVRDMAGGA